MSSNWSQGLTSHPTPSFTSSPSFTQDYGQASSGQFGNPMSLEPGEEQVGKLVFFSRPIETKD